MEVSSRQVARQFVALSTLLAIYASGGCGGKTEPVSVKGSVEFAGKPIPKGEITLRSTGEVSVVKFTAIRDGKFAFDAESGLIPGEYEVIINASRKVKRAKPRFETLDGEDPNAKDDSDPYIPDRYNKETELKITLVPGENSGDKLQFKLRK